MLSLLACAGTGSKATARLAAGSTTSKENISASSGQAAAAAPAARPSQDAACPGLQSLEYIGRPCTHVRAQVSLPGGRNWKADEVQVRAAVDALHVSLSGSAPLAVPTGVYIKPSSCACTMSGDTLTMEADCAGVDDVVLAAEAHRPLPLGSIALQSSGLADKLD